MRLLSPARYVESVESIDLDALWESGARTLLLDRDNTLVPRDSTTAPKAVSNWLAHARELGFGMCLISNNWHRSEVRLSAAQLGIDHVVCFACKPLPIAIRRAMGFGGSDPSTTVMIGDQLFTDVLAGKLAGVRTILVRPQSTSDMWYTHIFRVFERRALKGVHCEDGGRP